MSARGGNLLTRATENYLRPLSRDERDINGADHDGTDEDAGTPQKDENGDVEDPNSAGARALRGLRHAPPQRQLYQSDLTNPRRIPLPNGQLASPVSTPQFPYNDTNPAPVFAIPPALAAYEPKQQLPLTLRPIMTPANNYEQFKLEQKRIRDGALARLSKTATLPKGMMLPGTGFPGPNIYARTLLSLQSNVLEEQEYALHHLVKISHERGDKYCFNSFPGLAEALLNKVLDVTSLILDIDLDITYERDIKDPNDTLINAFQNTPGLRNNITSRKRKRSDYMESEQCARRLKLINEAGLVLRNMVMLEENSAFLSRNTIIRDLLIILLNLPKISPVVEIQNYGLEIAEQLSRYFEPQFDDHFFWSLLSFVQSSDRGVILTSLRAICRLGADLQQSARLQEVPCHIIQQLCSWTLVEDEELRLASLDFLYQFTAVKDNVEMFINNVDVDGFIKQLVRLLTYNARLDNIPETITPIVPPPTLDPSIIIEEYPIPKIPKELVEQLLVFDEPERSSQWLRSCFEEDPAGEITQIALWQAYQVPFSQYSTQRPLLPAKDFITNVSNTLSGATAQVVNGTSPRFVIKGIKARRVPVDAKGRAFMRCVWHMEDMENSECGEFALWPKHMWEHIVERHLNLTKDVDGKYGFPQDSQTFRCKWADCKRFMNDPTSAFTLGMHVKTHLPDASERAYHRSKHNKQRETKPQDPGPIQSWHNHNTQVDERRDAAGLPLSSVLVLRNLARQIPKTPSGLKAVDGESLVEKYFLPVREKIYTVMAYNQSLGNYLPSLITAIDARKAKEESSEENA